MMLSPTTRAPQYASSLVSERAPGPVPAPFPPLRSVRSSPTSARRQLALPTGAHPITAEKTAHRNAIAGSGNSGTDAPIIETHPCVRKLRLGVNDALGVAPDGEIMTGNRLFGQPRPFVQLVRLVGETVCPASDVTSGVAVAPLATAIAGLREIATTQPLERHIALFDVQISKILDLPLPDTRNATRMRRETERALNIVRQGASDIRDVKADLRVAFAARLPVPPNTDAQQSAADERMWSKQQQNSLSRQKSELFWRGARMTGIVLQGGADRSERLRKTEKRMAAEHARAVAEAQSQDAKARRIARSRAMGAGMIAGIAAVGNISIGERKMAMACAEAAVSCKTAEVADVRQQSAAMPENVAATMDTQALHARARRLLPQANTAAATPSSSTSVGVGKKGGWLADQISAWKTERQTMQQSAHAELQKQLAFANAQQSIDRANATAYAGLFALASAGTDMSARQLTEMALRDPCNNGRSRNRFDNKFYNPPRSITQLKTIRVNQEYQDALTAPSDGAPPRQAR